MWFKIKCAEIHFSHVKNGMVHAYPKLMDDTAHNTIKSKHFIAALPYSIIVVLPKEKVWDFDVTIRKSSTVTWPWNRYCFSPRTPI